MDNEGPMDGDPEAQRYGMLRRPIVVGTDLKKIIVVIRYLFDLFPLCKHNLCRSILMAHMELLQVT